AGSIKSGVFMIIWSVVVVGMIDNFVRPLFMSGSANMSTVVIFFSILGGLNFFGFAGLLYGPLIFGITMVLFYIYELEFTEFLDNQDKKNQAEKA
ncbi:MAG: AI-2E family transporter, partial [Desulfobacteraceae bacterium]|nr:AI-2E family transporter [Desulfobacteraceae bacterium]